MDTKNSLYDYLIQDRKHMADFLVSLFSCDESALLDFISSSTDVLSSYDDSNSIGVKRLVEDLLSEERSRVSL